MTLYSHPIISLNNSSLFLVKTCVRIFATTHCVWQFQLYNFVFNIFPNKMMLYIHIFWPIMIGGVLGECHRTLVIAHDGRCSSCIQPTSSISCLSQMAFLVHRFNTMFHLHCRVYHSLVSFAIPRYNLSNKENVSGGRLAIFHITGPICIGITFHVDMFAANMQSYI